MNKAAVSKQGSRGVQALMIIALGGLIVGCGNPADGVQEADVSSSSPERAEPVAGAKTYTVSSDSTIGFTGSKITGSHAGGFKSFTGTISVADGKIVAPSQVEIDMDSTWSDSSRLTGHLKNADFFDVPSFPTSSFVFTGIEASDAGHKITGDLTLHGVTKSISFDAKVAFQADGVSISAEFVIKRFDFEIVYKGRADDLIRDEVVIALDIKAGA